MTWPTDRPGYPRDAERDGDHLIVERIGGQRFTRAWWWDGERYSRSANSGAYALRLWPAEMALQAEEYLGPCYTQADLDAAVQAERAAIVAAVEAIRCSPVGSGVRDRIAEVILARGPTPALDAALAQARRETWEKAVEICAAVSGKEHRAALNYPAREEGGDGSREDSLNAALAAMDCAAAIRSAAAGEEGK